MTKQDNMRTDKCEWTIVAPMGSKVNITFTSMKMLHGRIRSFMGVHGFTVPQSLQIEATNKLCNNSQLIVSITIFV